MSPRSIRPSSTRTATDTATAAQTGTAPPTTTPFRPSADCLRYSSNYTGQADDVGTIIADKVAGLTAVYATTMALFHRERTGEGQEVEVRHVRTMASFMLVEHANGAMFDLLLGPAVYPRTVAPNRRPYRTSDGYIAALIYNDKHWNAFINAVQPAWNTSKYATLELRADEHRRVYGLSAETMKERTTEEWLTLLRRNEIPAARLNTPDALFDESHLNAVGMFETAGRPCTARCDFRLCRRGSRARPGRVRWAGPLWPKHLLRARRAGATDLEAMGSDRRWTSRWGGRPSTSRGELRESVNSNVPDNLPGGVTDNPADLETAQAFCRLLAERNLLRLVWPEELGGGAASAWEQTVVREEMWDTTNRAAPSTWG